MKQNKTSPVRRKIHFIPIRPQSQQLPPVGSQPTRQRFLSANNGNNNNGVPTGGCIQSNGFQFKSNSESVLPSRITNDLHIQQQQQQLKEEMNETILLQDSEMLATTTDILTPVYIQLDNEGQSPTEGLMFTLPPGTALIQTCNDNIGRIPLNTTPRRFYITNGSRIIPAISKSVQVLQPLKVMNVIHHHHQQQQQQQQLQHHSTSSSYTDPIICSPMMSSELLSSSSSYSCNSSPNSIVSPLSNDVFLPMQQVEMIMPTTTNSYHHNHQSSTCMDVYQFDGENHLDMCIEEEIIIDEDKMNAKHLDTMTNIISLDECMDTVNDSFNTTSSSGVIHEWSSNLPLNDSIIMTPSSSSVLTSTVSSSMKPITLSSTITTMNNSVDEEEIEGNRLVVSNQHLPLTINVMKSTNDSLITLSSTSSSSTVTTNLDHHYHHHHHHHHHHLQEQQQQHHDHQNNITIDNDLTDTDFSITNDTDNFDSSFDAMMNSIDITTFLPGTFQTNVEVEGEDEEEVEEEHGKHCIDNDFDNELTHQSLQLVSYSNNNNNDNNNNNHDNHLIKIDEFNDSCHEIIDSGTSIESSFINNDNQSQLYKVIRSDIDFINNQYPTSRLVTSLHKVHKYSSPTSIQTSIKSTSSLRMNSLHELLTNTPQVYSSTLADLDSLDKSSLFIIKPEWSVLA
ncbi:transcription factor SOX-14 [Schistosoma japonicum]|uniref:Transcription factor SOX-14 n=1 Tax=Schistosoma japonicum TaxID=6182 RepID=A0A4Z2DPN3_SCHJA|nr:transcription factor SOX-14 [Schistosoma japonicum]